MPPRIYREGIEDDHPRVGSPAEASTHREEKAEAVEAEMPPRDTRGRFREYV